MSETQTYGEDEIVVALKRINDDPELLMDFHLLLWLEDEGLVRIEENWESGTDLYYLTRHGVDRIGS
jgi:hypothetical protein